MDSKEIYKLFDRYNKGLCTDEERLLVDNWLTFGEFPELKRSDRDLTEDLNRMRRNLPLYRPSRRLTYSRIAAAAVLLIALTFGLLKYYKDHAFVKQQEVAAEIFPEGGAPILTLANGNKVALNKEQSSIIIKTDELKYIDGSAVLTVDSEREQSDALQSIETPYGVQYQVILEDGTKVYLNAGSTLKFPQSFAGRNTREVFMSGEGYFEVAKNKKKPFVVHSAGQDVEVLGTHFNLKNYPESKQSKTTLIEGSVRVVSLQSKMAKVLRQGQQSILKDGDLSVQEIEVEAASSWKDGVLDFRNETIVEILQEIARAYNVEVLYKGNVPQDRLFGKISKNKSLQSAIKILELSSDTKFVIEGRKILVYPSKTRD